MKIKIWVNGDLFYEGVSTRTLTRSNNRIDLQMDGADVTTWSNGDTIGLWTELLPVPDSPADRSIVYYDTASSSWLYGQSPLGISDSPDFQDRELTGQTTLTRTTEEELEDFGGKGYWSIFSGGTQFYISKDETGIIDYLSNGDSIDLQVPGMASPFTTTLTSNPGAGTGKSYFFNILPAPPGEILNAPNGTELQITSASLGSNPSPPIDGDVLQWVEADEKFVPTQLPDAVATRALLGIGEYADDAAAGTGGVTSGAMYYNTTSSDYRLKT